MNEDIYQLFKAYDIRGTYPKINGSLANAVGFSLVKDILNKENIPAYVNVMHDHRLSSNEIYSSIVKGIRDAGGEVNPLGLGSTDMLYAACQLFKNSGVMITASHNPKDDNGIKIVKKVPQMIGLGSGLEIIRDSEYLKEIKQINIPELPIEDTEKKEQLLEYYRNKIREIGAVDSIQEELNRSKLKVVVDTGNGMGGYVMQQVKVIYPQIEFIPLYWELDGTYPNHQADPIIDKNIVELQSKIIEEKADFGIAFDGDCDRAFFVDENGNRIIGDYVVAILAKHFLTEYFSHNPTLTTFAPAIVFNKPASRCTEDVTKSLGGIAIPSKQGHNSMKANLSKNNGLYGGEHSGHHYFGLFSFMDGGVFAVATIINMLLKSGMKASELASEFSQKYLLSGELNFKLSGNATADERIKIIDAKLKNVYMDAEYDYLDGISVIYPDWKFNIRLSNTEPLLRLNVEVINNNGNGTKEAVIEKVNEIKALLELN